MTPVDETTVRAALLDCYDLEMPCNIVDLGMVNEVIVTDDPDAPGAGIAGVPPRSRVVVEVTPAHADEAEEAHLHAQIVNRVCGIDGVSQTIVHIRHDRPWSPAQISSRGRRTLGLSGNPTLVQIVSR